MHVKLPMTKPPLLKKGDSVAIAAPARKISRDELQPAISLLESWGLNVFLHELLFCTENQFAGSDAQRSSLMQELLDSPDIKAIFCARGGYGTVRIIDSLDFSRFQQNPKWIVGYSDITVLHSHIACHTDIATLHATMPIDITQTALNGGIASLTSLHNILFHGTDTYSFPLNNNLSSSNRPGTATATVVGGNLSVLYSLLGSNSDISTNGKILLLEDLDEYLYHIDRMAMALKRAGKFSKLKGLIVGKFTSMHDNSIPFGNSAEEIILNAVADYDYPVALNANIGHIGTENHAIPLNSTITLSVTEKESTIHII